MKRGFLTIILIVVMTLNLVALQLQGNPIKRTISVGDASFDMIFVKGGMFKMGNYNDDPKGDSNEKPVHDVTLSDYYIGKTEVTQGLWEAVMKSNPSKYKGLGDDMPVEMIYWEDCQQFIEKLNAATGRTFRLPTEAEWEFAARGGNESKGFKYAGSNDPYEVAWSWENSSERNTPSVVAKKLPNELGIYDMSGNIEEWCGDWVGAYTDAAQVDPIGPSEGIHRVKRGGCYYQRNAGTNCRVTNRSGYYPDVKDYVTGLRLVMVVEPVKETIKVGDVSFNMTLVDGGTFKMGNVYKDPEAEDDDMEPVHDVTLSTYYIGTTEVTQQLWKAVMGSNPSYFLDDENLPVEMISWEDCQQFVKKLSEMTGKTFRLPTEAEWEFAARGGNSSKGYKYAGSNNIDDVAWYISNGNGANKTHITGLKAANELGLYDMTGNVWEWCSDWYDHYSKEAQINPTGPVNSEFQRRCMRGGGWSNTAPGCRVAFRSSMLPEVKSRVQGLRLVMKFEPKTYDITIIEPVNGTLIVKNGEIVIANGMKVEEGSTLTIEAMPANGYALEYIRVDGDVFEGNNIEIKKHTMIAAKFKLTVGIEDVDSMALRVYPNPVEDVLNIEGEYERLEVYDINGQMMMNVKDKVQINVGNLPDAVYIIRAYNKDKACIYRLIKK